MAGGAKRWLIPGVIVVVAALVASVAVIVLAGSDPAGASVTLERAGRPGVDPFTASVTIGEIAEFPDTIRAINVSVTAGLDADPDTGGLQAEGTLPGLYGGTQDETVCDPDQLAGFLTDNQAKAQAWADVLGIKTADIADYIAGLTPVVLTTDTRVTNHGYANGRATPRQSVLQTGTAVLVGDRGVPRVKCGCGNPLTQPTTTPIASTTGNPWPDYQAATVTTITPAPQPATAFTLTNITTGDTYQQTIGDAGGDGSVLVHDDSGVLYQISDTGAAVKRIGSIAVPGRTPTFTDIAARRDGAVFITSFDQLYRLNPETAEATPVGSEYSTGGVNALEFLPSGELVAASEDGLFLSIDPASGAATTLGEYGSGLRSSGDLAITPEGLLATAKDSRTDRDVLVRVDPSTGIAQIVDSGSQLGFSDVYGLFVDESDRLMGLLAEATDCRGSGALVEISRSSGIAEFRRCLPFSPYGATKFTAEPRETSSERGGGATADIRTVDFANFTYPAGLCGVDEPVTLVDGKGETGEADSPYGVGFELTNSAIGDLTGDGTNEAAVEIFCVFLGSANGNDTYISVFTAGNDEPVPLAMWGAEVPPEGWRVYVGSVEIVDGQIVVEESVFLDGDNHADGPSGAATYVYAWDGDSFTASRR